MTLFNGSMKGAVERNLVIKDGVIWSAGNCERCDHCGGDAYQPCLHGPDPLKDVRQALIDLSSDCPGAGLPLRCFCDMRIGSPMVTSHTAACLAANKALQFCCQAANL